MDPLVLFDPSLHSTLMGIGPLAVAGIATAGSFLLDKLFNKPSGTEESLQRAGVEVSEAEAERIRDQALHVSGLLSEENRLRSEIEGMIRGFGGQGRPPVARLDLRNPQDIGEFTAGIQPTAELNRLMELLSGVRGGTGAAAAGLGLSQNERLNREDQLQQLISNFLFTIPFSKGGGSVGGGKESTSSAPS